MQKPENSRCYDALIVGLGLAGGLLAWELVSRGWRILVLDDGAPGAASRVAAGLINPITGPRLVKTPLVDNLLPAAFHTLRSIEAQLGGRFLHPMPMLRRFDSRQTLKQWRSRIREPAYQRYLDPHSMRPEQLSPCSATLGGFTQLQTAWLDTAGLLNRLGDWLSSRSALLIGPVTYDGIAPGPGQVKLQGLEADRIIFCEGYRVSANPWFDWLPLQPAKGEILTLATRAELKPQILSAAGRWLLPLDKHRFRFGATYTRESLDAVPTHAGRDRLLADLAERFPDLAECTDLREQRAGVRPGTRDRQPFVGIHPELPALGVFNGFGSKGSVAIPWYAQRFADFLTTGAPLPPAADIGRWWNPEDRIDQAGHESEPEKAR